MEQNTNLDLKTLFNISYGLYVVTCFDGVKDNGLIVNTVMQVSSAPLRVAVGINKANYSHDVIKSARKMNVNCLSTAAPFKVFESFGFVSGRNVDKFASCTANRSQNNLLYLPRYINAYFSLKVEDYVDLDSHGLFICSVTETLTINNEEPMTYTYYQNNVKPKPAKIKGYVCTVCGYVHEGETLPDDFICPWCKHPASDFEPMK